MKRYLDARCMEQREKAHAYLKEQLNFPDYYGANLDALHDCLAELSETELVILHAEEAAGYYKRVERVLLETAREEEGFRVFLQQEEKKVAKTEEKERKKFWKKLVERCELGELIGEPQRIQGGYLHRMYRLETTSGSYAVKRLNPLIMQRPDAMRNFRQAEALERVLEAHGIPIVPALERKGERMQSIDGQYCYVFPWIEGKAAAWQEITKEQCQIIGRLLAEIHMIEFYPTEFYHTEWKEEAKIEATETEEQQKEVSSKEVSAIQWESYQKLAEEICPELGADLRQYQELLCTAKKEYDKALKQAPAVTSICHSDMDSKNVLWMEGKPYIIDLECLEYGNPVVGAFQLALSWAGGAVCELDFDRLTAFLDAYQRGCQSDGKNTKNTKNTKAVEDTENTEDREGFRPDWGALYGAGFSWLDWLEYNVKRALGLECQDEEEKKLGLQEARATIERIVYYASLREELLAVLKEI